MVYRRTRRVRSYRSSRYSAPRRVPFWVRTYAATGFPPDDPATGIWTADLLPDTAIDPGGIIGATVMRTHVAIQIMAGTLANTYGMVGFGVLLRERNTISPLPLVDYNDVDWMFYKVVPLGVLAASSLASASTFGIGYEIDCKSKRRIISPSHTLSVVVNASGITSEPEATLNYGSSVLLKP